MIRILATASLLTLAACSTQQVMTSCQDAQDIAGSPLLALAPADVQVAASVIKIGGAVCGSPEYAAARDKVLAFLASNGVKLP